MQRRYSPESTVFQTEKDNRTEPSLSDCRFHSPISPPFSFSQTTTWPARASGSVEYRTVPYSIFFPRSPLADSRETNVSNQSGGPVPELFKLVPKKIVATWNPSIESWAIMRLPAA